MNRDRGLTIPQLLVSLVTVLIILSNAEALLDMLPAGPRFTFDDVMTALETADLDLRLHSTYYDRLFNTHAWSLEGPGIRVGVLVFPKRVTAIPANIQVDYAPGRQPKRWKSRNVLVSGVADDDATWRRVVNALNTLGSTDGPRTTALPDYLSKIPEQMRRMLKAATPNQVIEMYFRGINEKDYDLVLASLSPGYVEANRAESIVAGLKDIVKVTNVHIRPEHETNYLMEYAVTFDLEVVSNPSSAWGLGSTTRFFMLSKQSSRWCIVQIGSCP